MTDKNENKPVAAPERVEETPQGGKIYAASRASVPERPAMWKKLREQGVRIVSSWIDEAEPTADLGELWARIATEIASADVLVLYAEKEDFPLKGAFIEAGLALGMGKPIRVVLPGVELEAPSYRPIGSWIKHPLVSIHSDVEEACQFVSSQPEAAGTGEPAKELSDLLCSVHANLDKAGKLKPFDNCIACIRNQRDELLVKRFVESLQKGGKEHQVNGVLGAVGRAEGVEVRPFKTCGHRSDGNAVCQYCRNEAAGEPAPTETEAGSRPSARTAVEQGGTHVDLAKCGCGCEPCIRGKHCTSTPCSSSVLQEAQQIKFDIEAIEALQ